MSKSEKIIALVIVVLCLIVGTFFLTRHYFYKAGYNRGYGIGFTDGYAQGANDAYTTKSSAHD